jgi:hypothetical protein
VTSVNLRSAELESQNDRDGFRSRSTRVGARPRRVDERGAVVWVYPDSRKLGVSGINGFFRFDDAVGYWHGEEHAAD